MASDPRQQALDLLSGYSTPSNLLPEGYKESFDKIWYQEYVQYRETVKPKLGTNGPSYDSASGTYMSRGRSSPQLDDLAHGTSANITKCDESLEDTADALIFVSAGVKSQDFVFDGFSSHDPGVEQARLTPAMEELDLIIEEDKARTHQQVLDQQIRDQQHVSEERLRETEARVQDIAAEERARRTKEGTHVKGRRRGLPLLLEAHGGLQEVMTCYDTGTHDNHMSRAKATELGYTIDLSSDMESGFQLPNGKIIKAVGHVVVAVQFARKVGSEAASMTCRFNVFERLALPVLIGMTFLQATETITRYTSRMVDLPTTWKRSLYLGRETVATADTGSNVALVSGEYATKHQLEFEYGCEELMLADGSLEYTRAYADVTIGVYKSKISMANTRLLPPRKYMTHWKTKRVRFYILESLQFDVILDEATVDDLSIFEHGLATIMSAASSTVPSLSPVIHLRSVEASIAQASVTLREKTKAAASSIVPRLSPIIHLQSVEAPLTPASDDALHGKTKARRGPVSWLKRLFLSMRKSPRTTATPVSPTSLTDAASQIRAKELPRLIIELDQAENRRLDQIERRGASAADDIDKQRYTDEREKLILEIRGLRGTSSPLSSSQSVYYGRGI
ncbi:hypothetical protein J4E93_007431 [Alternaria ventricosa]|uniref:uncharacterized protein n=1 Tax=Alternaria ventricosa TaxID=1187951 RepID=UPI0020C1E9BA|nr:uncharacterized protein J4E93_007431 [Alternaria ventricosa]KAI4642285.1 hypothetical protein J4E93_007431 [Alternaria ventricosa]